MASVVIERFNVRQARDEPLTGVRTATREFDVIYDPSVDVTTLDENDAVAAVFAEFGVIAGALHPRVSGIWAATVDVNGNDDARTHWTVRWDYNNNTNQTELSTQGGGDGSPSAGNPIQFEQPYGWEIVEVQEPVTKARFDTNSPFSTLALEPVFELKLTPPRNSAGDPFDPPLTMDAVRDVFTLERNELASPAPVDHRRFQNAINSETVVIGGYEAGEGVLKAKIRRSRKKYLNGIVYRRVQYRIEHAGWYPDGTAKTWDAEIADFGYREKNGSDGLQHIFVDGQPVTVPYPLDGFGNAAASVDDDVQYRRYRFYHALDFSALQLPVTE